MAFYSFGVTRFIGKNCLMAWKIANLVALLCVIENMSSQRDV